MYISPSKTGTWVNSNLLVKMGNYISSRNRTYFERETFNDILRYLGDTVYKSNTDMSMAEFNKTTIRHLLDYETEVFDMDDEVSLIALKALCIRHVNNYFSDCLYDR